MSIEDDKANLAELERLLAQLESGHIKISDTFDGDPEPDKEALRRDIARLRAQIEVEESRHA